MSEIKELKQENAKLRSDLERCKMVADLLQRENKHLHEEVDSLQSEIEIMDKTRKSTDEILHQLSEAQTVIMKLQDQIEDYKNNYIQKILYEQLLEKFKEMKEEKEME